MGTSIKSFMPLPMSHGTTEILRNQSLDPTMDLLSHLFPLWQPLVLRLTSVASGTQGDCRTLCHATSELDNHGRKKGNIAHQQKPWETILLLAKLCRSLFSECTSHEMQLLTEVLNCDHPENEGSFH